MAEWKAREIPAAMIAVLCFAVSSLAMLIWPFVALADVMSLGGYSSGRESALLILVSRLFRFGSLAYPLVYVPCLLAIRRLAAKNRDGLVLLASVIPFAYAMIIVALFWAGSKCELAPP